MEDGSRGVGWAGRRCLHARSRRTPGANTMARLRAAMRVCGARDSARRRWATRNHRVVAARRSSRRTWPRNTSQNRWTPEAASPAPDTAAGVGTVTLAASSSPPPATPCSCSHGSGSASSLGIGGASRSSAACTVYGTSGGDTARSRACKGSARVSPIGAHGVRAAGETVPYPHLDQASNVVRLAPDARSLLFRRHGSRSAPRCAALLRARRLHGGAVVALDAEAQRTVRSVH